MATRSAALQFIEHSNTWSGFLPFRCVGRVGSGESGAIVRGENLQVLAQLRASLAGAVSCAYLDPPYNNHERFAHYSDRVGNWLEMLADRLRAIRPLLTIDGSVWISIDDREMHYLKVAADKVFGRENFVTTIVWQQRTTRENRKVFSNNHEYVLVYARSLKEFTRKRNRLPVGSELLERYKNPDEDPRGPWQSVSANAQAGHGTKAQFYTLIAPNGRRHAPPKGRCWIYTRERMQREIEAGNVWFGTAGDGVPRLKRFLAERRGGLTPHTLWTAAEVGTNDEAKKHIIDVLPRARVFETPKPERLLSRIIQIATSEGDLVIDPFLGSGTTTAVAMKLGRRFIGIEQGEHALTHCAERLKRVVAGESGGISRQCGWVGGGGFKIYEAQE